MTTNGRAKTTDGRVVPLCTQMVPQRHGSGEVRCGQRAYWVTTTRPTVMLLCHDCLNAGVRRAKDRRQYPDAWITGDSFSLQEVWPLPVLSTESAGRIVCEVPPAECSGKVGYDCPGCVRLMYGFGDVDCPHALPAEKVTT